MEELKITTDKKRTIKNIFIDNSIIIKSIGGLSYLPFVYQEIYTKFGMSTDDVNLIIYLNELSLFSLKLMVIDKEVSLKDFYQREYVVSDFIKNNIQLYRLSDKSKIILKEFNYLLKSNDKFIKYNRQTDIDLETKMKSVLRSYGDKIK